MTIFELIGFLIVILALLAPVIRRMLQKRFEQQNPEEFARRKAESEAKEREALRRLFKQVGREIPPELMEEEPAVKVAVRRPRPPARVARRVPAVSKQVAVQDESSSIQKLVQRSSGRDMVLLREILERPVSLR